jgi:hypothetical protein
MTKAKAKPKAKHMPHKPQGDTGKPGADDMIKGKKKKK